MNKMCRHNKRFHRINRIIRKHVTNRSHAQRLRASKRVYNSKLFSITGILKTDKEYAAFIMQQSNYPLWVSYRHQLAIGTGPITYETAIGL